MLGREPISRDDNLGQLLLAMISWSFSSRKTHIKAADPGAANNSSNNQNSIINVKISSQLIKLQLHVRYAWFYVALAQGENFVKVHAIFLGKRRKNITSQRCITF